MLRHDFIILLETLLLSFYIYHIMPIVSMLTFQILQLSCIVPKTAPARGAGFAPWGASMAGSSGMQVERAAGAGLDSGPVGAHWAWWVRSGYPRPVRRGVAIRGRSRGRRTESSGARPRESHRRPCGAGRRCPPCRAAESDPGPLPGRVLGCMERARPRTPADRCSAVLGYDRARGSCNGTRGRGAPAGVLGRRAKAAGYAGSAAGTVSAPPMPSTSFVVSSRRVTVSSRLAIPAT